MDQLIRQFLDSFISTELTVHEFYTFTLTLFFSILSVLILWVVAEITYKWYIEVFVGWFEKKKHVKSIFTKSYIPFFIILIFIIDILLILAYVPVTVIELILPIDNLLIFLDEVEVATSVSIFTYAMIILFFSVIISVAELVGLDNRKIWDVMHTEPRQDSNRILLPLYIIILFGVLLTPFYIIAFFLKLINLF